MEIITIILQAVVAIAVPALTIIINKVGREYAELLATKIKNERIRIALQEGLDIIARAVGSTQQTYVDELKKQGKFDIEAQKTALLKAKSQAIALMNKEVRDALAGQYEDVDVFMTTYIESLISKTK